MRIIHTYIHTYIYIWTGGQTVLRYQGASSQMQFSFLFFPDYPIQEVSLIQLAASALVIAARISINAHAIDITPCVTFRKLAIQVSTAYSSNSGS